VLPPDKLHSLISARTLLGEAAVRDPSEERAGPDDSWPGLAEISYAPAQTNSPFQAEQVRKASKKDPRPMRRLVAQPCGVGSGY